jgi:hypothetical protein
MDKTTIKDIRQVRQKEKKKKIPRNVYKWWLGLKMLDLRHIH